MKFLVTKTFQDGNMYDSLFLLQNRQVYPILPMFPEHVFPQPSNVTLEVPHLPMEITMRITHQVVVELLKTYNFEEALKLIAINHFTIHRFYYALFGAGSESSMTKYKRLSRVLQITASLYDNYMLAEMIAQDQTVVLDYDGEWIRAGNHPFYPWEFRPEISVIDVKHHYDEGVEVQMGPNYGDIALLINPFERHGIMYCKQFAYPFIHFLVMDHFRFLSVFQDPKTKYYFTRFSMFLTALFGPYCRVFFFTKAIPLNLLNEEFGIESIFEHEYCFEELPKCVRK